MKHLYRFNRIASFILLFLLGFQACLLYYYFHGVTKTAQGELIIGADMLASISMILVIPTMITSFITRKTKRIFSSFTLTLCTAQVVILLVFMVI